MSTSVSLKFMSYGCQFTCIVVKVLQRIAQSGSIIIMSIHQPSYTILGLLDHLIFLSHGNTVYSGTKSLVDFNKLWQLKEKNLVQSENDHKPKPSLKDVISASISRGKLVSSFILLNIKTFEVATNNA